MYWQVVKVRVFLHLMHISVEVCVLERDTLPPPTAPRAYVTFVICVTNRKRAFLFLCIARGFK